MSKTNAHNVSFSLNIFNCMLKIVSPIGYLGSRLVKLITYPINILINRISNCFLKKTHHLESLSPNKSKKIKANKIPKKKLEISEAVYVSADSKTRKELNDVLYSIIGNTKENSIGLPNDICKICVDYLEERCFGENEWRDLFGSVDPAPPLPSDFSDIWNGPCPFFPEKKVCETHMLVYIPSMVAGKPFTLNMLIEIVKRSVFKNEKTFLYICSIIIKELGNKTIDKSRWVLMAKDLIPGSLGANCQQEIIPNFINKGYDFPNIIDAMTCMFAQHSLDPTIYTFNRSYTYCKERFGVTSSMIGGFQQSSLVLITNIKSSYPLVGVAPLRKLSA